MGCGGNGRELQSQTTLLAKTPVHPATRRHCPADVLAKLRIERRPPGHELEPQSVIHHREPARRERDALAVGSGDMIARSRRPVRQSGLGRDPGDGAVQLLDTLRQFATLNAARIQSERRTLLAGTDPLSGDWYPVRQQVRADTLRRGRGRPQIRSDSWR